MVVETKGEDTEEITQETCHLPAVHRQAAVRHETVWDQKRTWDHSAAVPARPRTVHDGAGVRPWLRQSAPASYFSRSASLPSSPSAPTSPSVNTSVLYNNNNDDIHSAVIMAKPLQEFIWFIWWMQTQRRGGRQPSDQANRLRRRVRQKEMAATFAILILLSPRADTHFTVPWRVEGWVDLSTAVRVRSPCPRLYIAVTVVINTTARGEIWT